MWKVILATCGLVGQPTLQSLGEDGERFHAGCMVGAPLVVDSEDMCHQIGRELLIGEKEAVHVFLSYKCIRARR